MKEYNLIIKFCAILIFLFSFVPFSFSQNITQPILLYPSNGLALQESFPSFSWTPSFPNQGISYQIKLVEVLEGQTPEAAILANPNLFFQEDLSNNLFLYPTAAPLLQTGKKYAWQINSILIQKTETGDLNRAIPSEVFWFEVAQQQEKICWALPADQAESKNTFYVLHDQILRFRFEEGSYWTGNQFTYAIKDIRGNTINKKKSDSRTSIAK